MPARPLRKPFAAEAGRGLARGVRPGHFAAMSDDQHDDGHDSRRPAVIGLAVVAVLVVVGYYLVTSLRENANLEDCLMSGRRNCAPIEMPSGGR